MFSSPILSGKNNFEGSFSLFRSLAASDFEYFFYRSMQTGTHRSVVKLSQVDRTYLFVLFGVYCVVVTAQMNSFLHFMK